MHEVSVFLIFFGEIMLSKYLNCKAKEQIPDLCWLKQQIAWMDLHSSLMNSGILRMRLRWQIRKETQELSSAVHVSQRGVNETLKAEAISCCRGHTHNTLNAC